jgi:lipopolysaccharide/colanic/teichoic acid biosynthesis glycosyltransferase
VRFASFEVEVGFRVEPIGPAPGGSSPKARRIGLVLVQCMMQSESGTSEVGIADAAAVGAGPYGYSDAYGWSPVRVHPELLLPSELFRYRVVKRLIDLLLVAIAMPVLLPVILLLAVLVRATSPGSVFFSHRRICKSGSFFSMWKFRTMCVNSSEVLERYLGANPAARVEWNRTHKLQHDPRVTRIGRIMRRFSLDELPQIWNVMSGRMSLVGPRPIVAAEVEKYGDCFHCYTSVKPGVTGLWQVSGRSTLSYEARVKLDCDYAAQWGLLRDLRILAVTVRSVVNQEGAY